MILVLSTTQATSLVSTTRHNVEQEIKHGNLTGHTWVIDDAEAECWPAVQAHTGPVEAGQASTRTPVVRTRPRFLTQPRPGFTAHASEVPP